MYFIYTHPPISLHPFIHQLFPKRCRNERRTILVTIFFRFVLLKNRISNAKHPIRIARCFTDSINAFLTSSSSCLFLKHWALYQAYKVSSSEFGYSVKVVQAPLSFWWKRMVTSQVAFGVIILKIEIKHVNNII